MPSSKTAPQWTKEKIEEAFRRFVMEHGRLPRARELNPKYGLPQRRAFDAAFGMSPYQYAMIHYPDLVPVNRRIHDEAVVAYLTTALDWTPKLVLEREKAFIQKHRRLPDIDDYTSENGLPPYSVFSKLARDYYEEMLTLAFQDFLTGEERPAEQRGGGA